MKLHELKDRPGATKRRKRVGRGPGSGKGTTAGRGNKGQKSRSGVALGGFEGGQMPLYQRLPKRGFNKPNRKEYAVVNLGAIQAFIDRGKIDPEAPIDESTLLECGLVRRVRDGVRVLAEGGIRARIDLVVTYVSKPALTAVEAAGGTVSTGHESSAGH